jgi:hypothetical protein
MIGAARKPETNTYRRNKSPALLPQDPTVCQTLPSNPHRHAFLNTTLPEGKESIRTHNRPVPPGTYSLIFHP